MRRPLLAAAWLGLALACTDDPAAPRATPAAVAPARVNPSASCTRHWARALGGKWSGAANWNPVGVPGPGEVVCIDAPGSYVITLDVVNPRVAALVLGGPGITATLQVAFGAPGPGNWTIGQELRIEKGSTLDLRQTTLINVQHGAFTLAGTLKTGVTAPGVQVGADSLILGGAMVCDGILLELVAITGPIRSSGSHTTGPVCAIEFLPAAPGLVLEGGSLGGSGNFLSYGSTHWKAGALPLVTSSGLPPLTQYGDTLFLESPTLSGAVSLRADTTLYPPAAIVGDLGSGVQVRATTGLESGSLRVSGASGGPLTNLGTLTVNAPTRALTLTGPGLVNAGTVTVNAGAGLVAAVDSTVNSGLVNMTGPGTWTGTAGLFRNRGTVTSTAAGPLGMSGATFVAEPGSVASGPMALSAGTLTGTGTVGDVTAVGGKVQPGSPVGTLTAQSLVLDPSSSVTIEVAGATAADRVDVLGVVTYGGTLAVQEVAPFLSAACGQAFSVITDHSTGSRGAFAKFTGLAPATTRAWRTWNPTGAFWLVGHNPLVPVSASPLSVTVTEGGAGAGYSVCLRNAAGANVTVTPTSTLGQVAAMPPLVFTPATWTLPQVVTVAAVNDALYEPPPQADAIAHTISSTAPPYNTAVLGPVAVTVVDNDGSANLELNLLNAPPVVAVGGSFTLSLREQNLGPDTSPGATITIPASAGYGYLSSTGVLSCSSDAVRGTTCQLGALANGSTQNFTITFTALAAGSYSTTYTLSSIQFDSNLLNNSRVQVITVN